MVGILTILFHRSYKRMCQLLNAQHKDNYKKHYYIIDVISIILITWLTLP
jgi:bifunctional N-acetylglucosamine-1-phosphate-uridyltransferase/glucosamine-1-phosphate-acetyltransferase GlmU-like protein